ncbi:hypothetical protein BU26DRAFT_511681 [Trematosphaeria pertusa]|uniref:Uncharacterized protein n=1 Tax=Trematosphaeria pertusa TaxID=390896 RepID=A0A6A6HUX5_9PLEO|nr:uncharacterized protein BU26DRAFT_511681 [Trematosphaeria pertusa]KAF2241240.1 hypothetical protein BU26DRAFT_511681 [Trematosphaeria pertusa]
MSHSITFPWITVGNRGTRYTALSFSAVVITHPRCRIVYLSPYPPTANSPLPPHQRYSHSRPTTLHHTTPSNLCPYSPTPHSPPNPAIDLPDAQPSTSRPSTPPPSLIHLTTATSSRRGGKTCRAQKRFGLRSTTS